MKKVVINTRFGGFSLSRKAVEYIAERGGEKAKAELFEIATLSEHKEHDFGMYFMDADREDPLLVEAVEVLGETANGMCAKLKIIEIPDDIQWTIEEYDGSEHVAEQHRTWY